MSSQEAGLAPETLERLVAAAQRAPSGDNTQPWRFQIDRSAGRVALLLDETRDPSPMNAGQRMARIAVGAALENLLRAAAARGLGVEVERPSPPAIALLRVTGSPAADVNLTIAKRVTNRRPYDGRPLSVEILARLEAETPPWEGVTTHWITGSQRLRPMAQLIARADEMMLGEAEFLRAFLRNVRFDAAPEAEVEEGLSLASLELRPLDRFALRLLPHLPLWLRRQGLKALAAHSKMLAESATLLCVLVAPDSRVETDLLVGRALERAWLALTAEDLAAQPMMSLLILENVLESGSTEMIGRFGASALVQLRGKWRALLPEIESGRPAFLLRAGFAPPPTGRVGRRPTEAVIVEARLSPPSSPGH